MEEDRGFVRFFSYLNFFVFSMLLLVLAGNFLLLIVGWAFVGAASYMLISLLVPAHDGDQGRHQGVRDQRRRRRRARARHVLHLQAHAHARLPADLPRGRTRRVRPRHDDGDLVAGCILLLVGAFAKSAQIPLHTWLPDAMEGPTPVSALIHAATMVTAGVYLIARMHPLFELRARRAGRGRGRRRADAADRRHDRPRADRHQARDRLLDDVADRLHDHGRLGGRLRRRPVPPDDPRLLQGAAVHGRRLADRRDGRRAVAGPDGRLSQRDAVHLRLLHHRRPRAVGHPAVLGLLLQGRDPARRPASAAAGTGRCTWPATSARS